MNQPAPVVVVFCSLPPHPQHFNISIILSIVFGKFLHPFISLVFEEGRVVFDLRMCSFTELLNPALQLLPDVFLNHLLYRGI